MTTAERRTATRICQGTLGERLAAFERAIPFADETVRDRLVEIRNAVVRTHAELEAIHLSAVSSPLQHRPTCFDCGDRNLDVFYTSKRDHCQLCAPCFRRREKQGVARAGSHASRLSASMPYQSE